MRGTRIACPCPKCKEPHSKVVRSAAEDGGETIRRRVCPACGHRWYTAQEPEYVISRKRMIWRRTGPELLS